jgi:hypothetical protein
MPIREVVFLRKETRLAVVPALHDVQRYAIEVNAGAAGHGRSLPQSNSSLAPFILQVADREHAVETFRQRDRCAAVRHRGERAGGRAWV